jgi:hypothetical protein
MTESTPLNSSGELSKAALNMNHHGGAKRLESRRVAQKLDRIAGALLGTQENSAALKTLTGPSRLVKFGSAQKRIFLNRRNSYCSQPSVNCSDVSRDSA